MALPDSIKLVDGTSYIIAYDTEWPASPTLGWSATVNSALDLGGLASAAMRQSAKLDLGANRDPLYKLEMTIEMETDPTSGQTIDVYVGWSDHGTAGTGNPAGLSGSDAAYSGYGGGTAAEGVRMLEYVGSLVLMAANDTDNAPQVAVIGTILPKARYCCFVVHNNSGVAVYATADETALRLTGITHQVQD